MSRRRHHEEHEEHENHEAWVIPYADMLTLLMGLFLVMWSIGSMDLVKLKQVSDGFASAVGVVPGPGGGATSPVLEGGNADTKATDPASQDAQQSARALLSPVQAELGRRLGAMPGVSAEVRLEDRGVVIVLADDVLFASGTAALSGDARAVLAEIAGALGDASQQIVVEGHTDDQPTGTAFPSNWELSSARATTVVRELVARYGIEAHRISASGRADTVPRADNGTAEGRASNRRVEIIVSVPEQSAPTADGAKSTTATTFDPVGDPIGNPLATTTSSSGG
jgi:chemotaxis protein MotB